MIVVSFKYILIGVSKNRTENRKTGKNRETETKKNPKNPTNNRKPKNQMVRFRFGLKITEPNPYILLIYIYIYRERERHREAGSYENANFLRERESFFVYKIIYDSHTKIHEQKPHTKSHMIHVQNHI